jgi:hypothetical protein
MIEWTLILLMIELWMHINVPLYMIDISNCQLIHLNQAIDPSITPLVEFEQINPRNL